MPRDTEILVFSTTLGTSEMVVWEDLLEREDVEGCRRSGEVSDGADSCISGDMVEAQRAAKTRGLNEICTTRIEHGKDRKERREDEAVIVA